MKLPFRPPRKKKLQATTAAARRPREADFTEEPNVKLTSAFIVVLVLHVVAVGGMYAFNAINAHQAPAFDDSDSAKAQSSAVQQDAQQQPAAATTTADAMPGGAATVPATYRVRSGDTIARIAAAWGISAPALIDLNNLRQTGGIHVGQELKLPAGAVSPGTQPPASSQGPRLAAARDSGATYTVVHGDTPVSIARKLHVPADELLRLNKIEDPRKLRIGMKLRVPVKQHSAA